MAQGPGRYDDLCTEVREKAQAEGVILVVIGGRVGSGFSVQVSPEKLEELPEMLRVMATQIEADIFFGEPDAHTHNPV